MAPNFKMRYLSNDYLPSALRQECYWVCYQNKRGNLRAYQWDHFHACYCDIPVSWIRVLLPPVTFAVKGPSMEYVEDQKLSPQS